MNHVFMLHRLANWFAAEGIPEPRRTVIRDDYHPLTIGTELR